MPVNEVDLTVKRTARIYSIGKRFDPEPQTIWIVFHGYGEMSVNFIQHFSKLDQEQHLVLSPEALSNYYLRGGKGEVGSSWMTRYEREHEIQDQVSYLDQVYELYELESFSGRVNLLGFSQGVATMTRWMCLSKVIRHLDHVIFWSGSIPDLRKEGLSWGDANTMYYVVFDPTDKFLQSENFKNGMAQFEEKRKKPSVIHFTGGHYIDSDIFMQLGQTHNWL